MSYKTRDQYDPFECKEPQAWIGGGMMGIESLGDAWYLIGWIWSGSWLGLGYGSLFDGALGGFNIMILWDLWIRVTPGLTWVWSGQLVSTLNLVGIVCELSCVPCACAQCVLWFELGVAIFGLYWRLLVWFWDFGCLCVMTNKDKRKRFCFFLFFYQTSF